MADDRRSARRGRGRGRPRPSPSGPLPEGASQDEETYDDDPEEATQVLHGGQGPADEQQGSEPAGGGISREVTFADLDFEDDEDDSGLDAEGQGVEPTGGVANDEPDGADRDEDDEDEPDGDEDGPDDPDGDEGSADAEGITGDREEGDQHEDAAGETLGDDEPDDANAAEVEPDDEDDIEHDELYDAHEDLDPTEEEEMQPVSAEPAGQERDPRVLADSLAALLGGVDVEIAAVSDLSRRIDELAEQMMGLFAEQRERMTVLLQLRDSVNPGSLADFLNETIRPDLPQRLVDLGDDIETTRAVLES